MEITLDVDVKAPRERFFGQHQQEAVVYDARVVDQHIHAAEFLHDGAEHILHGGKIGGIRLYCQSAHAEAFQLLHDALRGGLIGNIVDRDIIAALGQRHGAGLADPAGSTRYDCNTHAFALPSTTALTQPVQLPATAAAY